MESPILPLLLDPNSGHITLGSGETVWQSAIGITILTPIGSRPMFKDFGSNLHRVRFMNIEDPATDGLIIYEVRTSLETWIPEIALESIVITKNDGSITIDIGYLEPENEELEFASVIFGFS